jgi:ABC-type nitrate/sulfonate/bicarbonate transport system ATPase subunit
MTLELTIRRKDHPGVDGKPGTGSDGFQLTIAAGEVCAVVGPAGIGKSALVKIAAGLDRDVAGGAGGRRDVLGILFQKPQLLPWRTIGQNLALALPGREARIPTWLAAVGLAAHEHIHAGQLSTDMAKRAALARALAVEPALLLLDEPFVGLSPESVVRIRDLLADYLRAARPTTLIVSRTVADVASLADRIVMLAGSPARIVRDSRITGPADEDDPPPVYPPSTVFGGGGRMGR